MTQTAEQAFRAAAQERILIFDGGYGTGIQRRKLTEADYRGDLDLAKDQKGNNDLLCLTRPDVVADIHNAYFAAGADMVETNTFSSTQIAMADYGAGLCGELHRKGWSPPLCRGVHWPDEQDALAVPRRQRSRIP